MIIGSPGSSGSIFRDSRANLLAFPSAPSILSARRAAAGERWYRARAATCHALFFVRLGLMVDCATHRRWFPAACGLLSLCALQLVAVSQAGATCGDWLARPGERMAAHETPIKVKATNASAVHQRDSTPLSKSKPCNGPYCRSAPFQPVPATPVNITLKSDRLAFFGEADIQPATFVQFHQFGEPDACVARGFPSRIEHPPRV